jgi:hypothetical protein
VTCRDCGNIFGVKEGYTALEITSPYCSKDFVAFQPQKHDLFKIKEHKSTWKIYIEGALPLYMYKFGVVGLQQELS